MIGKILYPSLKGHNKISSPKHAIKIIRPLDLERFYKYIQLIGFEFN